MRIGTAFPSDYLKASDLAGRMATVTIDRVEMKELGGDVKPVLFFQAKERGLVLNKTNASTIADSYGEETDAWRGKPLVLYEAAVDFQGRRVQAIRVRVPTHATPAVEQRPAPPPPPVTYDDMPNDDIPF